MKTTGYILVIAGLGMMLSLIAGDIATLMNWEQATRPIFIASIIGHIAAVLTAAAGGNLVPNIFRDRSYAVPPKP